MVKKRFSHRRRRLAKTLIPGVVFVILGVLFVEYSANKNKAPYTPGESIEGITRNLDRSVPKAFLPVPFRDVSEKAGISFQHFHGERSSQLPEDMGSGVAWGDFDNDGDPDLYIVNEAGSLSERENWDSSPATNKLYRNEGDGTFIDITEIAGVGIREIGMAAAWGDYDSDGYLDLLVTSYGAIHLFRNLGNGTFQEVSSDAGIARQGYWTGASWGDYDRDGDLDLYVCGYVHYTFDPEDGHRISSQYSSVQPASLNPSTYPPHENILYENNGDGTFKDVTLQAGVLNDKGRSLGVSWCDFDEDGWIDLYIANDISDNVMYRNLGDGTFEDISHAALVADYRGAMGIAVGDWDGDLDMDLFVSHWIAQENALYVNLLHDLEDPEEGSIGTLSFMDEADGIGLGQIALDYIGWAAFFFDFDNDGRLDLFVNNGSTFQKEEDKKKLVPMNPLLFWNGGAKEGYFEVGRLCGDSFSKKWVGRGAAPADYDGDGDLDLAVVNFGEKMVLLRNEGKTGHHWLEVKLRSKGKNTFGVGGKVTIRYGKNAQTSVVGCTPSYLSQPDLTLHFGLGEHDRVDLLQVLWPSGKDQELKGVKADQILTVQEPI